LLKKQCWKTEMTQKKKLVLARALFATAAGSVILLFASGFSFSSGSHEDDRRRSDHPAYENARRMIDEGKHTFRYDTFGDEAFWGGDLKLHEAIAGAKQGGVGSGVSPNTALAVGLKVDVDALPQSFALRSRKAKLTSTIPRPQLLC
jgi:hypothetical protein